MFFQKLERSIPEVLQNYISVKSAAAELFPEDRDSYREMKGWYIDAVLAAARNAERKMEDDDRIKYWMYEIEMSDEMNRLLEEQLALREMTPDEFACAAAQHVIDHPAEAKRFHEEYSAHPDERLDIRLVRYYPVYKGETAAQARRRKFAEEAAEAGDTSADS